MRPFRAPLLLLLAALAASLSLLAAPRPAAAAAPPSSVTLGVLLPLSGGQAAHGRRVQTLLDLLVEDLNNGTALANLPAYPLGQGVPLHLSYHDTRSLAQTSLQSLYHMHATEANLLGVLGPLVDALVLPTAMLTSELGLWQISPAATAASLSNADMFPTFSRTALATPVYADAWIQTLLDLEWYRFALLTTEGDFARGFADMLQRRVAKQNNTKLPMEMTNVLLPALLSDVTTSVVDQALSQLADQQVRIFLVWANDDVTELILRMAHERGMVGLGPDGVIRQWGGFLCTYGLEDRFLVDPEPLRGALCLSSPRPNQINSATSPAAKLEKRLQERAPDLFSPTGHRLGTLEMASFNALLLFVGAAARVFSSPTLPNTGASLFSQTDQVNLTQLDGDPLRFFPNGDLRVEPDVTYWNADTRRWTKVGTVDLDSFHMKLSGRTPLLFVTGLDDVPKDRPRVYVTGDPLPAAWDGKTIVLAFVVAVLGSWTALILLEQTLSFWTRGLWVQASGWLLLAAGAQGACNIFAQDAMALSALTLDVDATLWIQPGALVAAALYPVGGVFIAFLLTLLSVEGGLRAAKNVNEVSDVSSNSSTTASALSATSSSHSSSSHSHFARHHLRLLRSRLGRSWVKFRDSLTDVATRSTWRIPLASAVLSVVQCTVPMVLEAGYHWKAAYGAEVPNQVGAFLAAFALNHLSLAMYFHVTRSAWRYASPFVLSLTTLLCFLLLDTTGVYSYRSDVDISSGAVSELVFADSLLAVQVAIYCAAACIGMMIFNVLRLRVSRNALDKMLLQVSTQVRALETDIDYERECTQAVEEQGAFLRRSMEIINLCRPVWRPYSIALALADPDLAVQAALDAANTAAASAAAGKAAAAVAARKDSKQAAAGLASGLKSAAAEVSGVSKGKGLESEVSQSHALGGGAAALKAGGEGESKGGWADLRSGAGGGEHKGALVVSAPDGREQSASEAAGGATPLPGTPQPNPSHPQSAGGSKIGRGASNASNATAAAELQGEAADRKAAAAAGSDWHHIHAPKQEKQLAALLKEIQSDLNNFESAVPTRVAGDIRLPQVLSNPATLELMKDALLRNLSPENIALWIDVQRYRTLDTLAVRRAVAEEIYSNFIVTGAKFEVNLSSFMRDYVGAQINRGNITSDLFDEVEREIYKLMQQNNFDQLASSNMYKLAAIVLGHPAYRLRNANPENNSRGEIGGNKWTSIGVGTAAPALPAAGSTATGSRGPATPVPGTPVSRAAAAPRVSAAAAAGTVGSTATGTASPVVRALPLGGSNAGVAPPSATTTPRTNNFLTSQPTHQRSASSVGAVEMTSTAGQN